MAQSQSERDSTQRSTKMTDTDVTKRAKSPPIHIPLTLEQLAEGLLKTPPKKAESEKPKPAKKRTRGGLTD